MKGECNMKRNVTMRLIGILLSLAMLLSLMPISALAVAGPQGEAVTQITATTSVPLAPEYGEDFIYPEFTLSPSVLNVPASMCNWYKYVDGEWIQQPYNGEFREGMYYFSVQFRIDGDNALTHHIDEDNITVTVNGEEWDTDYAYAAADFSYVFAYSPVFEIELPEGAEPIERITDLSATLTEPVVGEALEMDLDIDSPDYIAYVIQWYEGTFHTPEAIDDMDNYTVKEDTPYVAEVIFECVNADKELDPEAVARINGRGATWVDNNVYVIEFSGVDTVVNIDISNGKAYDELTAVEQIALSLLWSNDLLVWDDDAQYYNNKDGKPLFTIDENDLFVLADGVTEDDNISYVPGFPERNYIYRTENVDISEVNLILVPEKIQIYATIKEGVKATDVPVGVQAVVAFLANKGLLILDEEQGCYTDSTGKLLFTFDDDGNIVLGEGVTGADNIVYALTQQESEESVNMFGKPVGKITLSFLEEGVYNVVIKEGYDVSSITDEDFAAMELLIDNNLLTFDDDYDGYVDGEGNPLFYRDDNNKLALAEGLTEDDNIIYELTDREIELSEDILGERITKIVLSYEYLDDPTDTPSDEPTDDPSDTPSDEPTDDPSDTPSDDPTDEPTDTADNSVIVALVIMLCAAACLTVTRKKKSTT